MSKVIKFMAGPVLGIIIGWALGFLQFPYIEQSNAFLIGFLCCSGIVLFIVYARIFFLRRSEKTPHKNWQSMLLFFLLLVMAAAIVLSIQATSKQRMLALTVAKQQSYIQELSGAIQASGSGDLSPLMGDILHAIQAEAITGISDSTLSKLAALSYSFAPYKYFEGDSLSERAISPQRGQLLIGILLLELDSASFAQIKQNVTFSYANLMDADLHGTDLQGMDLHGAHFNRANLQGALLNKTDLSDAVFHSAKMDSAQLIASNLKRADLQWCMLNGANLSNADLNGAQMMNAQCTNADMQNTLLQYADISYALFYQTNLNGADLMGTKMMKTNFTEADMRYTNLRLVSGEEAIFKSTQLHKSTVDTVWFNKIPDMHIGSGEDIVQKYILVNDTADQWNNPLYRLTEKDK